MKILLNHCPTGSQAVLHCMMYMILQTDELIVAAGEEITADIAKKIEDAVLKLLKSVLYLPAKANVVFV